MGVKQTLLIIGVFAGVVPLLIRWIAMGVIPGEFSMALLVVIVFMTTWFLLNPKQEEHNQNDFSGKWKDLSDRENDVAQLIVQGYTNAEIATTLFISIPTVKTHVSNIYQKIGVNNRGAAIVFLKKYQEIEKSSDSMSREPTVSP